MSNNGSWHEARNISPIARNRQRGMIDHPGPMRGRFHRSPLPTSRGTVNPYGAIDGFQGVGLAAYHFQHHQPIYPSERRQQACCHRPHYHASHLRMQTWGNSTLLSFLYQSERRHRHF